MSKGFTSSPRIALLAGVILLSFASLGFRLVSLHVLDRDELMKFVVKARHQIIEENGRRGDILDSRGSVLATSRPQVDLGVDPQVLRPQDEAKWPELAALIGMPLPQLRTIFATKTRKMTPPKAEAGSLPLTLALPKTDAAVPPVAEARTQAANTLAFNFTLPKELGATATTTTTVADDDDETTLGDTEDANGYRPIRWTKLSDHIDEATYDKITALGIKGVYKAPGYAYRRIYPHNGLAAHVLGYVNKAGQPVTGAEAYADFYLRGRNGWREGERDGSRNELAQFRTRDVPASDGYNVKLSIDSNVQSIIEDEIGAIVAKYHPQKATIIVSDARSGFILGLANYPSYNPNAYADADLSAQRNLAVTDQYEPGSVFKIVAAAGALEEGLVTPATTFDCSIDKIMYTGKVDHNRTMTVERSLPPEDHHFEDPKHVSVAQIISYSSNRGAVQLAMKMGEDDFCRYATAFGFGQRTGFPFGGEIGGTLHLPGSSGWDSQTITRMPMGHAVDVTVMQMQQAMGVFASGGVLLQPQIVREIIDPAGETVSRFDRPIKVRRVVSERTAQTMARLLMGVASPLGTAPEAAIPNFQVAGKTGTTQKIVAGKYSDRHHVASFVGFFPASRPRVVISVIVDDADAYAPGGVAYGAKIAAPAFKHVGEQLIQLPSLDIKPAYDLEPSRKLLVMEGGRR